MIDRRRKLHGRDQKQNGILDGIKFNDRFSKRGSAMFQTVSISLAIALCSFYIIRIVLHKISPKPIFLESQIDYISKKPFSFLNQEPLVDISIIIPAYNEEERLIAMLAECIQHLKKNKTYEIILVDDGSTDGTVNLARNYVSRESGKGGAVTAGVHVASGKLILFVDADGATRFSDLDLLVDAIGSKEVAVAIGSRAHMVGTEAVVKRSAIRNFLMHGLHGILWLLGVRHIKDTQCGFKLFTRSAAQTIFPNMHVQGWIFDIEILLLAQWCGIDVHEVPVTWHEVGGSKVNLMQDSIKMLKDLILIRACYFFSVWKKPRKIFKVE